ncbi:hypothetical protein G7Z17_g9947 [Cylindrodendrum hubeiense]|uniref:Uncharacterized protein n=1 Tax=Cylindrodendrum hubeiense TaxID=595255 RepID=A0A9P5H859_9HYPO|nr:hypothetical protein G7Z17_g9947 [Cylindrodendrum hubeiense]
MGIGIGRHIWGIKYGYPIHVSKSKQALFYPAENKQQSSKQQPGSSPAAAQQQPASSKQHDDELPRWPV